MEHILFFKWTKSIEIECFKLHYSLLCSFELCSLIFIFQAQTHFASVCVRTCVYMCVFVSMLPLSFIPYIFRFSIACIHSHHSIRNNQFFGLKWIFSSSKFQFCCLQSGFVKEEKEEVDKQENKSVKFLTETGAQQRRAKQFFLVKFDTNFNRIKLKCRRCLRVLNI